MRERPRDYRAVGYVLAGVLLLPLLCAFPSRVLAHGWVSTGSMTSARVNHTATLLPDGKVLIAGGEGSTVYSSAELYDPATRTFGATGSMTALRRHHTATLLPDGKVLVTGGDNTSALLQSAELFDPNTGIWSSTGTMQRERFYHMATLLQSGKVLVTGGTAGSDCTAELYDPQTGAFAATGSMTTVRESHTATLLPDGKVLIAGGNRGSFITFSSAELYDPQTGTFTATGSMASERRDHAATLLQNGKVLVTGGMDFEGSRTLSPELYDPETGTWSSAGTMQSERVSHTATLLQNGEVLIAGGAGFVGPPTASSAELYDPGTGAFTATTAMTTSRWVHTATLLQNGDVLVAGGFSSGALSSAEVYDGLGVSPPAVFSTNPSSGAADIPVTTSIVVTFDEPMDAATIVPAAFTLTGVGTTLTFTVGFSGTQATLTPASPLAYDTEYTVTVKNSVTNGAGIPMVGDYILRFSTEQAEPAPVVWEYKNGMDYVKDTFGCAIATPGRSDFGISGIANALVLLIPAIVLLARRRR